MVCGHRKYAFDPPKVRFCPNTKLPTNTTGNQKKLLNKKEKLRLHPTRPDRWPYVFGSLTYFEDLVYQVVSGYRTNKESSSMCT
jgi:hypothetical protein